MVKEIRIVKGQNDFYNSVARFLITTLDDKYILLASNIDFNAFLDKSKIHIFDSEYNNFYISEYFRTNNNNLLQLSTFFKLSSTKTIEDYLLIIEVNKSKEIIEAYSNFKMRNNDEQRVEKTDFMASNPRFSLKDVILNKNEIDDLESSLVLIINQELIYNEWGFSEIDSKPRLILNFFGAPGTGKTMSAHALANELQKNILLINYSDIESKYVGDAPKNLVKVFEEAKKSQAVLFFDEADSFLGKRIESVSGSSDQAINSLRSQMLILLEDFEGVVIFATNLVKNYDKAFESRILKHIEFKLPCLNNRERILDRMFVDKLPLDIGVNRGELLKELSKISEGFSGRELKNAMLECLSLGAHQKKKALDYNLFIKGFTLYSQRKESLSSDNRNILTPELKKKIESKIKETID